VGAKLTWALACSHRTSPSGRTMRCSVVRVGCLAAIAACRERPRSGRSSGWTLSRYSSKLGVDDRYSMPSRLSIDESRSMWPVTRSQCHVPMRPVLRANASRVVAESAAPAVRSPGDIAKGGLLGQWHPTVEPSSAAQVEIGPTAFIARGGGRRSCGGPAPRSRDRRPGTPSRPCRPPLEVAFGATRPARGGLCRSRR